LRRSRGLVVNNIQFNSVESLTATVWRYEETKLNIVRLKCSSVYVIEPKNLFCFVLFSSPDLQLFMDTTSLSIVDICCLSCCYCIAMWNCNYYL